MAGEQRGDGRRQVGPLRVAEVGDIQLVLRARALVGGDEQVASGLVEAGAEEQRRLVRPLVDQAVLGLRRADGVIVDLLVAQGAAELLAGTRLGVAAVEEAAAVVRPRQAGKLDPAHGVAGGAAGPQIAHVVGAPVGAALALAVGDVPSVGRRHEAREGNGAVGGELVRVEHHLFGAAERGASVAHALPLEAAVARVVPSAALPARCAHLRIVPQLGDAAAEDVPHRQRGEVGVGDGVLRRHPGGGLRRVQVLQPAIGIGDDCGAEPVGDVHRARFGIREGARLGRNLRRHRWDEQGDGNDGERERAGVAVHRMTSATGMGRS